MNQYETITGLIILAFAFIGGTGNLMVLIVISHNRGLQNATQILIANLSGAHFLLSVLCLPLEAAYLLSNATWLSNIITFKVVYFFNSVFSSAAILTLAAIAIDRYYSVVYPLEKKMSIGKGRLMVLYIWIHAFVISIPKLFLCVAWQVSQPNTVCTSLVPIQTYLVTYMLLTLLLPLVITIVAYVRVWRGFRISQRKVNIRKARRLHASNTDIRLLKMLLFMVFCFVLLWAPQVTYLFLRHFHPHYQLSPYFALTAFWISKIQPVVDPITYGYLNKQCRKNLRQLARSCSVRCTSHDLSIDDGPFLEYSATPSSQQDANNHLDGMTSPGTAELAPQLPVVRSDCIAVERSYNQCNAYSLTIQADVHKFKKVETRMYSEKSGVHAVCRAKGYGGSTMLTDGGVYTGPPTASTDDLPDHGGIYSGPEFTTAGGVYVGPPNSPPDVVFPSLSLPTPRPKMTNEQISSSSSLFVNSAPLSREGYNSKAETGHKRRRRTTSILGKLKDKKSSKVAPEKKPADVPGNDIAVISVVPVEPSTSQTMPSYRTMPLFLISNVKSVSSTRTTVVEEEPKRRKRSKILHKRLEEKKRREMERLNATQISSF